MTNISKTLDPNHIREVLIINKIKLDKSILNNFYWLNEPQEYYFDNALVIKTDPEKDFWQRTHYGFRKDDGHALLTNINKDFSFTAKFKFDYQHKYDQCGIFLRLDSENWIRVSTEYINKNISKLGSVVTNLVFSDWATRDISSDINTMWYRINKDGKDFLIESLVDGKVWTKIRITHLIQNLDEVKIGVYACSPKESSFKCKVEQIMIENN